MHVRVMLMCAFGVDISDMPVDYEHNGRIEKKIVSYALRMTFHDCIARLSDPHILIFPFLADCYFTPSERATQRNCMRLRDFIQNIV